MLTEQVDVPAVENDIQDKDQKESSCLKEAVGHDSNYDHTSYCSCRVVGHIKCIRGYYWHIFGIQFDESVVSLSKDE